MTPSAAIALAFLSGMGGTELASPNADPPEPVVYLVNGGAVGGFHPICPLLDPGCRTVPARYIADAMGRETDCDVVSIDALAGCLGENVRVTPSSTGRSIMIETSSVAPDQNRQAAR